MNLKLNRIIVATRIRLKTSEKSPSGEHVGWGTILMPVGVHFGHKITHVHYSAANIKIRKIPRV